MNVHCWRTVPFMFAAAICVGGCNGHFRFSDDQYRALGSPEPTRLIDGLQQSLRNRSEITDSLRADISGLDRASATPLDGREQL